MKRIGLRQQLWIGLASVLLSGVLPLSALAEVRANERVETDAPAVTVAEWMTQLEASLVEITGVRVEESEAGLQILLETASGELPVPTASTTGNALVVEISNAALALTEENFQQFEPTEGIALVQVSELSDNRVQVVVTGTEASPTAQVETTEVGLTLNVVPGIATAGENEDAIQLVVTGEEDEGYNPSNTSVGTRTDTPLSEVPQSIQLIPRELIEDQGATSVTEALRNVPGVVPNVSALSVFDTPIIRGFGGFSATNDIFRRNGLRDSLGSSIGGETANVEQIEVLRGPASVLYGQGSLGGLVNIVTKQPLNEPSYEIEATAGNYSRYRGTVDLSGPLDEDGRLRYRLNAAADTSEGFIDFYDRQLYQIAPVLAWDINENADLTIEAEYLSLDNPNYFGLPAAGTVLNNPNGEIARNRYVGGREDEGKEIDLFRIGYRLEHRFNDDWRINNAFEAGFRQSSEFSIFARSLEDDSRTLARSYFDSRNGFDLSSYTLDTYTVGNFDVGTVENELVAGIELVREETVTTDNAFGFASSLDLFDTDYDNIVLDPPTARFDANC